MSKGFKKRPPKPLSLGDLAYLKTRSIGKSAAESFEAFVYNHEDRFKKTGERIASVGAFPLSLAFTAFSLSILLTAFRRPDGTSPETISDLVTTTLHNLKDPAFTEIIQKLQKNTMLALSDPHLLPNGIIIKNLETKYFSLEKKLNNRIQGFIKGIQAFAGKLQQFFGNPSRSECFTLFSPEELKDLDKKHEHYERVAMEKAERDLPLLSRFLHGVHTNALQYAMEHPKDFVEGFFLYKAYREVAKSNEKERRIPGTHFPERPLTPTAQVSHANQQISYYK
jgi:hypothetical protein